MTFSGWLGALGLALPASQAADGVPPADDYRQRNPTFMPSAATAPGQQKPGIATPIQGHRIEKNRLDRPSWATATPAEAEGNILPGEHRVPVERMEKDARAVAAGDVRRPLAGTPPMSELNRRAARVATGAGVTPPLVARYQDSLDAARAATLARFPTAGKATPATIHRFVFRRNAPDAAAWGGAAIVPAGGREANAAVKAGGPEGQK